MQPIVLVGTKDGLLELGSRSRTHLAGHRVTAIAVDRRHWWAAVDDRGIWRAGAGGGRRWEHVTDSPDHPVTCLLPGPRGVLVGTEGAHLLRLEGRTLRPVDSFEAVDGRRRWYTPWGDPADVRSLAADTAGRVYVNIHVGGIVRSVRGGDGKHGVNGGTSWQPTVDIEADVHQVLAHPTIPGLVFAAAAVGFGTSRDGGATWTFTEAGLHASYLRAVAVAGESVLVSASTGPGSRRAALYRRPVGSEAPFERCREGLPEWFRANVDTYCVAAAGSTVVAGIDDGVVFRSEDEGRRWEVLADGLPSVSCVVVASGHRSGKRAAPAARIARPIRRRRAARRG
jgi:hypothetical protein